MFRSCESVKTVKLSDTITSIGGYAFYSCYALTKIEMPNTVSSWGNFCFQVCKNLTSIGPHGSGASIEIPDSLQNIPLLCFGGCTKLTTVVLPKNIKMLAENCFSGCTALTSFTLLNPTPPTLRSNALSNTNNCPIYVPAESVNAYKTATNWISLASRIQALPTT